jgi:hypothetical protein
MKLTKAQLNDLETVKYFLPHDCKDVVITGEDIKMFFEHSEKGLHKDKVKLSHFSDGFSALVEGKRWRGIHIGMYEEGVLDGSMPYFTILGKEDGDTPIPRSVMEFMKKTMFQGIDAKLIDRIYNDL